MERTGWQRRSGVQWDRQGAVCGSFCRWFGSWVTAGDQTEMKTQHFLLEASDWNQMLTLLLLAVPLTARLFYWLSTCPPVSLTDWLSVWLICPHGPLCDDPEPLTETDCGFDQTDSQTFGWVHLWKSCLDLQQGDSFRMFYIKSTVSGCYTLNRQFQDVLLLKFSSE